MSENAKKSTSWLAPFFELNFIEMMERLAYNQLSQADLPTATATKK